MAPSAPDGASAPVLGRVVTASPEETFELGRRLGETLAALSEAPARDATAAIVIALEGDLGAGKTLLTKGLACGLGVREHARVTSPTFVIMQQYAGRLPIRHYDVYRLGGSEELAAIGFEEDIASGGRVIVVEWADRVRDLLPEGALEVEIEHLRGDVAPPAVTSRRSLTFRGDGARWAAIIGPLVR